MAEKVMTPKFRVAFASIWNPNKKDKYSVTMVFDKGVDLSKLNEAITACAEEEHGKLKGLQLPFSDGTIKADKDEAYEDFRGKQMATAASKFAPGLIDQSREAIIDEDEFYSGCYARATVTPYAWTYVDGGITKKGVGLNINNLQKMADGERYGGSRNAADDFDIVEETEEVDI